MGACRYCPRSCISVECLASSSRMCSLARPCWECCGIRLCCRDVLSKRRAESGKPLTLLNMPSRFRLSAIRFLPSIPFSPTNSFTFAEEICEQACCRPSCKVCGGFIRPCGSATAGCREKPSDAVTNKSSQNLAVRPLNTPAACCRSLRVNTHCNRSPSSPA